MSTGEARWWALLFAATYLTLVVIVTTKENLVDFIRQAAKAVVAVVVGFVSTFAASQGFDLTDAQVAALTAFLTGLVVYLVPNKAPEAGE